MKKKIILSIICLLIFCMYPQISFAGGMNSNEQSVYSVASGTFTYNGKQYRAKSSYLSQLYSYLCRDNIDLTAAQASSAISMIYNNVSTGVKRGYIVEVSSSNTSETTTAKPEETAKESTKDDSDKESAKESSVEESAFQTSEGEQTTTESSAVLENEEESTAASSESSKASASIDSQLAQENKEVLANEPSVENAKEDFSYDWEKQVVFYHDTSGNSFALPEDLELLLTPLAISIQIISIILLVIIIISLVIAWINKCFFFQKKENERQKRQKIRKIINPIGIAVLTIILLLLSLFIFVQVSLFNDTEIQSDLMKTDYYQTAYQKMLEENKQIASLYGADESICDDLFEYEQFVFISQNVFQLEEAGKNSSKIYVNIEKSINQAVDEKTSISIDAKEALGNGLKETFKAYADGELGNSIYRLHILVNDQLKLAIILLIVSLIGCILLLLMINHYLYEGIRNFAVAFILNAILSAVLALYLHLTHFYANYSITPDCIYVFVYYYLKNVINIIIIGAGISFIFGIFLLVVAMNVKIDNRKKELINKKVKKNNQ